MLNEVELKEVADALATLRGENRAWKALQLVIKDARADANDLATGPKLDDSERAYWCGADRQIRDLGSYLEDLRAGTHRLQDGRTVAQLVEEEEDEK